jgi:hypothetical protein
LPPEDWHHANDPNDQNPSGLEDLFCKLDRACDMLISTVMGEIETSKTVHVFFRTARCFWVRVALDSVVWKRGELHKSEERNLMGRVKIVSLGILVLVTALGGFVTLSGCSDGSGTSQVVTTPEAKKADEGLQGGMKDFMQSKGKTKSKGGGR